MLYLDIMIPHIDGLRRLLLGPRISAETRAFDMAIAKLRKAIERDLVNPTPIETIRGIGYRSQNDRRVSALARQLLQMTHTNLRMIPV